MSMTQASAEYFERVAGEWDNLRTGYFGEAVREAAIAHAYLRPEMVVADVGSGTGFMAAGLLPCRLAAAIPLRWRRCGLAKRSWTSAAARGSTPSTPHGGWASAGG